ncbi:response regulator [Thiohalobacter sp. IOR34]|uniref:GGDEF domain-containing response regulator n=1 Tax=Thiohalobacter sp. IOR34 TaxID=3057176 RepID=UPI0025AF408B|nr:response regulator [Thiohalobacter sp. IOR34]WJW75997.1 response regulator [Thiohalobacter sp. IOR34]
MIPEQDPATETKPRVLVVDDSRVIRIAAKKILRDEFEVLEAGDGEAAWEALEAEEDIALVISDLSMPYLDGMGLLRRLRESSQHRLANLPVIIVTGAEDDESAKSSAFAAGASDFLSKPFDSVQLLAHVRSHIKLADTEQQLEKCQTTAQAEPTLDKLTGLLNQRAFTERGHQELSYAIRHRSDLALILVDVDNFDKAFIKYGRPAGEAILKIFAQIVKDSVRREDSGGRVGLARFGLLLPSATPVGARNLAVRICQQIASRAFRIGGETLKLTASAAVVSPVIRRESRFEDLLAEGQLQLGRALKAGGNRVAFDRKPAAAEPQPAGEENAAAAASPAGPEAAAAAASPEPAPDIGTALQRLAAGEEAGLRPHLRSLAAQTLPLLEAWQRQQPSEDVAAALARLRQALQD